MQQNHFEAILENIESKMDAVLKIVAAQPTRVEFNNMLARMDEMNRRTDIHELLLNIHAKDLARYDKTFKKHSLNLERLNKKLA